MDHGGMQGMSMPKLPENADKVPLFPQDAFMEGPMMAMDKEYLISASAVIRLMGPGY